MSLADYITIYPTGAALLTGVLAIIVTFHPPQSMNAKTIWLSSFAFIALTAIIALFWQQSINSARDLAQNQLQAAQNQKQAIRDNEFAFMSGQMTTLVKLQTRAPESIQEDKRLDLILAQLAKEGKTTDPNKNGKDANPPIPLKTRALLLSTQILKFLADRPIAPEPQHETWNRDTQRQIEYAIATMKAYSLQFASKVYAIHDELAESGLRDLDFDQFYQNPTNPIGVRIVGERMGALAEKLP